MALCREAFFTLSKVFEAFSFELFKLLHTLPDVFFLDDPSDQFLVFFFRIKPFNTPQQVVYFFVLLTLLYLFLTL